ncbi:MAG: crossover junction endodeoxyribonuclease RuvC [Ketobacter sp.]|nr:crossover junction endodeoxyribonuclease RuvC [Ketobacter sp.]
MRLVTFDFGMRTGWASGKPGARPSFGHIKLTPCNGDYGKLMHEFGEFFQRMVRPGDKVAYESPIVHGRNTLNVIMITVGLAVEAERICYQMDDVDYLSFMPNQIKKTLAGHGWAEKEDMVKNARALGFPVHYHDEADAIGVWYTLLAMYDRMHKTNHMSIALDPLFNRISR